MKNNGSDPGPPFAVIGVGFSVLPRAAVIELLEKNRAEQSKANLALGPMFCKIIDGFREWSKVCDPGAMLQCPEARLAIIRLSRFMPPATLLSDEAQKQAEAAAEPGSDRLKLVTE